MIIADEPKKIILHNKKCMLQTKNSLFLYDTNHKIENKISCNFGAITVADNGFYYVVDGKTYECTDLFGAEQKQIDTTNHPNIQQIHKTNALHYVYQVDDYVCITNIESTILLHKKTPYMFARNAFFCYKNNAITKYDLTSTQNDSTKRTEMQNTKNCTAFAVKDSTLVYADHTRVYIQDNDRNIKKEYQCHSYDVTKIAIDEYTVYSACKEKIVIYEIANESKKHVCSIDKLIDMQIDDSNIYVLTQNELTVYERGSNKIASKTLFLGKTAVYKGLMTRKEQKNETKQEKTDIFASTKTKNYKKIEVETYAEDEDNMHVFEIDNKLYFVDKELTKVVKQYKGSDSYYKAFVSCNFLVVIEKEKHCTVKIYNDFVLANEYKFVNNEIGNIQSVVVGDFVYFLSKKHLFVCDRNGSFVRIVKNVKFVSFACNKVLYVKNKQIIDARKEDQASKMQNEEENMQNTAKISTKNSAIVAKNLKTNKFCEYKSKLYFLTKKGLQSYDFVKQKTEKKGSYDDFCIAEEICLITTKMNKTFVIQGDDERQTKENVKEMITNKLMRYKNGSYEIAE